MFICFLFLALTPLWRHQSKPSTKHGKSIIFYARAGFGLTNFAYDKMLHQMQNSLVFNKIQKFFLYRDLLQNDGAKVRLIFDTTAIVKKF